MLARIILNTVPEDETGPLLLCALEAQVRRFCPGTSTSSAVQTTPLLSSIEKELCASALRAQAECSAHAADFAIYLTPLGVGLSETASKDEAAPMAMTTSIATPRGLVDLFIQTFSYTPVPKKLADSLNHRVWVVKRRSIKNPPTPADLVFAQGATLAIQKAYVDTLKMIETTGPRTDDERKKLI